MPITRDEIAKKASEITSVTFYNLASDEQYRQTCVVRLPCECWTPKGGTYASIDANAVYKAVREEDGHSLPLSVTKRCDGRPSKRFGWGVPNHDPVTFKITVLSIGERHHRPDSPNLGRPRWREDWTIRVELLPERAKRNV